MPANNNSLGLLGSQKPTTRPPQRESTSRTLRMEQRYRRSGPRYDQKEIEVKRAREQGGAGFDPVEGRSIKTKAAVNEQRTERT